MSNEKNRYSLRVNERGAMRGVGALYNSGNVLPDDAVAVYDGRLHCNVY